MAKRPVFEFLLKLINFLLTLSGLSLLFLGVYCLIKWNQNLHNSPDTADRVFLAVDHLKQLDKLPSAWFIYLFLVIGTTLFLISCLGYVGTTARNSCCLSSYSVFLFGLVLAELIAAAFLLFNQNLTEDMLHIDKTGIFPSIYHFIHMNWKIVRWVVLVALILEVIALVLALYLLSMNRAVYDNSDDEIIVYPGSQQVSTDDRTPATGTSSTVGNGRENLVIV